MKFYGPIVRPQTDANSVFIEVTVGCTHNECTFCNFYKEYPFRVIPLDQVEENLKEASILYPHAKRIWASGGNPFALSTEKLKELAILFQKYFPKANIATYARVDDLYNKSVEDIRVLKNLGINDIVIGIESGDDEVLKKVKKGYTSSDIIRECQKLEEAGMIYRVIYLGGLGGYGKGIENALNSAKVFNQIHPTYMIMTNVSVLPDTELYQEMQIGSFKEASEKERIQEFRTLIANLDNTITVDSRTAANSIYFVANLPEDKQTLVAKLDKIIENFTETEETIFHSRRAKMTSV